MKKKSEPKGKLWETQPFDTKPYLDLLEKIDKVLAVADKKMNNISGSSPTMYQLSP